MSTLQNQIDELRRRLDRLQDRPAEIIPPRMRRLAVTCAKSGTYPEKAECPNTYWIAFVDGGFTPDTQGVTTASLTDRQQRTDPQVTARNTVEGIEAYCPIGTLVEVTFHPIGYGGVGQWWFSYTGATPCSSSGSGSEGSAGPEGPTYRLTGNYRVNPANGCYIFDIWDITFPAGTSRVWAKQVEVAPCVGSEGSASEGSGSEGSASEGSGSEGSAGFCEPCLEVTGDVAPDCTGEYQVGAGLHNGKCWWALYGSTLYYMRWNAAGWWEIVDSANPDYLWYKSYDVDTPEGDYSPGFSTDGIPHVALCPSSSGSSSAAAEPCGVFDEGTTPGSIDVYLANLSEGGCAEGCETSFGGSQNCTQDPEDPCVYRKDFGTVCGVACELVVTFSAGVDIEAKLNMGSDYIRWVLASQSGNGLSYADLALSFHSNTPTAPCGGSGSTCEISSVA